LLPNFAFSYGDDGTLGPFGASTGGAWNVASNLSKIDASGSTGNINVVDMLLKASGGSQTGGGGTFTAGDTPSTIATDTLTTGSGGGVFNINPGGGGSYGEDPGETTGIPNDYNVGNVAVNLANSLLKRDFLQVIDDNLVSGTHTAEVPEFGSVL